MREPSTFSALLARIGGALAARGIPYMVIGGFAAILYGEPRLTRDIDITVGLGPDQLDVDIILAVSAYEQEAMARARIVPIGGAGVRFASPEDVLIHKIIAGRPRDIEDARAILAKSPDLDRPYIVRWLREFEMTLSSPVVQQFLDLERQLRST